MARIRSIKPEFWSSGQVLECSPIARLLFLGMLNFADDEGRLPFSAKSIKAQIFPADPFSFEDIEGMIAESKIAGNHRAARNINVAADGRLPSQKRFQLPRHFRHGNLVDTGTKAIAN